MYKRPTRKKEIFQRVAVYTLMTTGVIAIVSAVVFIVSGYRFDAVKRQVEQSALVQFASYPSGATVEIDGKAIFTKTSTKSAVLPGSHEFVMWKEGYETWRKTLSVKAGSLTWLNYARLIPKQREAVPVANFEHIAASSASPSGKQIIVQPYANAPELTLVDISGDTVKTNELTLPADSYSEADNEEVEHTFTLGAWDEDGRYILVWHNYGESRELLVVDTHKKPLVAKNVTRLLDVSVQDAQFSGTSGNILYVLNDHTVRRLDLNAETISRALVTDAESFSVFDTDRLTYVALPDKDTGLRSAGVYREGEAAPRVIYTAKTVDASLHVAAKQYFRKDYITVSDNDTVRVFSGNLSADSHDTLKALTTFTLPSAVEALEFNPAKNIIIAKASDTYASYMIERNVVTHAKVAEGAASDLAWLDEMMFWSIESGNLVLREYDGANQSTIHAALPGQVATLSHNDKYLYSFQQQNVDGDDTASRPFVLQRIRMLL